MAQLSHPKRRVRAPGTPEKIIAGKQKPYYVKMGEYMGHGIYKHRTTRGIIFYSWSGDRGHYRSIAGVRRAIRAKAKGG